MATFGRDTIRRLPVTLKIRTSLLGMVDSTARLLFLYRSRPVRLKKEKGGGAQNFQ